eukprot:scaffold161220_cov20-Prasinocladus_malaysianus.AAC.1
MGATSRRKHHFGYVSAVLAQIIHHGLSCFGAFSVDQLIPKSIPMRPFERHGRTHLQALVFHAGFVRLRQKILTSSLETPYCGKQVNQSLAEPITCFTWVAQVRNLKSCTKIAVDFVSPESVGECLKLCNDYRRMKIEDKLQVAAAKTLPVEVIMPFDLVVAIIAVDVVDIACVVRPQLQGCFEQSYSRTATPLAGPFAAVAVLCQRSGEARGTWQAWRGHARSRGLFSAEKALHHAGRAGRRQERRSGKETSLSGCCWPPKREEEAMRGI